MPADRARAPAPHRRRRLTAAAAALLLVATAGTGASANGEPWRIADSDTFDLAGERIRLFGIDAPEYGQSCGPVACGAAATGALADILSAGPVRCTRVNTDRYGRGVARCRAGSLDVNREMVRRGMAWAIIRYADNYADEEEAAKASGVGIWQYPSQPAWEYRAEKWDRAAKGAPGGCAIKGNISASGKIYHAPWSPWYGKTRIDPERGEQWFCSEDEAVAAGWRAPRWR